MNAPLSRQRRAVAAGPLLARSRLADLLRRHTRGEVLFDAASRGRYSTDASIYQIEPVGVFVPRDEDDVRMAFAVARDLKVPILARGAGTSQCGQTVGECAGDRQHALPEPGGVLRPRGGRRDGTAGHRARPPQRLAQTARPVVSGRRVDQRAGHHRRDGGQQFLRQPLNRLRQHGAQRRRHRRPAGRRQRLRSALSTHRCRHARVRDRHRAARDRGARE